MITYLVFKIIDFVQSHEIDDQTPISEPDSWPRQCIPYGAKKINPFKEPDCQKLASST